MVSNGDRIYLHASHTIGMLGEGAAQGAPRCLGNGGGGGQAKKVPRTLARLYVYVYVYHTVYVYDKLIN